MPHVTILDMRVDVADVEEARRLFAQWVSEPTGRMICAANVHMLMEGHDDPAFRSVVNSADLVVADGRPLVWASKVFGRREAYQVRGLDLTLGLCEVAEREGLAVGLYGGEPQVTADLQRRLLELYPRLRLTYAFSPPFRPLSYEEDEEVVREVHDAGVDLLLVGLGCPKQELWMAAHRGRMSCVMVGVGAVFDMLAGRQRVAPRWMQRAGLEWTYRLALEPRRLWRRYAHHNLRFLLLFARQWLAVRAAGRQR
jgi:N-acetylglucosaminyldiphosphoundecaprenol N-acetyl-beta-D-mannosaminyltransferase